MKGEINMKKGYTSVAYRKHKCPVCGKEFGVMSTTYGWVYKIKNGKKVCSYKCMREWEKKHER
jgi:predicted nucleic acid-binding Zn ribbon protein